MIRKPREHSLCWEKGQGKGFVVRIAAIKVKFYGLKKIRQQLRAGGDGKWEHNQLWRTESLERLNENMCESSH